MSYSGSGEQGAYARAHNLHMSVRSDGRNHLVRGYSAYAGADLTNEPQADWSAMGPQVNNAMTSIQSDVYEARERFERCFGDGSFDNYDLVDTVKELTSNNAREIESYQAHWRLHASETSQELQVVQMEYKGDQSYDDDRFVGDHHFADESEAGAAAETLNNLIVKASSAPEPRRTSNDRASEKDWSVHVSAFNFTADALIGRDSGWERQFDANFGPTASRDEALIEMVTGFLEDNNVEFSYGEDHHRLIASDDGTVSVVPISQYAFNDFDSRRFVGYHMFRTTEDAESAAGIFNEGVEF